ncbi:coiled-coil domain-containing protein 96 isoform X1 [Chiloscyllium plagiosum]|uniref:coiled-coil domain-containing protein 96 isoform X1 n=2 Tax=Chiloscyllium plagiosum TaxID=36176 RepID=UPI001CB7FC31|nr:coiled-coil domain-containing protein 96 isoform X1 [Chiloscyllium plagiosum]
MLIEWDWDQPLPSDLFPRQLQQPSPQQSHIEQVPAALIEEEDEEGAAGDPPDHTPTTGPSLSQMGIETATHEPGINPGTPAGEEKLSEAVQEKETVSDVKEINFPPPSDGASPDIQEQKGLTTAELEMTAPEETKEMEKTTSPLPTSMTFSEGEKEEPLTIIGEDLARDDDPAKEEFSNGPPILELGTPERQATPINEEKIDDEVEDEQATFERMEMEYKYQALFVERQTLRNHNNQIQNKLADYYRKKMTEESKAELKKAHSDYEQRYVKFMDSLAKLQAMYREEVESYQEQIADLSAQCEEKQQLTEYAWRMFTSRKRSVAKTIINKRPGRHAALLELERIQNIEEQKEKEMRQIRFLTIKMKNKLKYYEYQLKAKEELAGGLNLIDYEQLKIENQSYGEKIEERNEEVTKMRKKIAVTVGIMTHIKEKLEYVEAENVEKKNQLMDLEAVVAQKREILTKTKQARDRVRAANFKLKEKCGLLCNKVLLRDYEDNVDTSDRLRQKLEVLKRQHADLTLDSYGIKKKIEWVKMGQLQTQ